MSTNPTAGVNPRRVPLEPGMLLIAVISALYKGYAVAFYGHAAGAFSIFLRLLIADLSIIFFVSFLIFSASLIASGIARRALQLAGLVMVLLFAFDCYLVSVFDERLSIDDIIKFSHFEMVASFVGWKTAACIAAALAILLLRVPARRSFAAAAAVLSLILSAAVSFIPVPQMLARYSANLSSIVRAIARPPPIQPPYSNVDITYYRKSASLEAAVDLHESKPNIILLMVESLSAVDSMRTSGLTDHLPGFDKLSRDGKLFTNFVANYRDSEGGIISLLSGMPPLPYPTSTRSLFNSYAITDGVPRALERLGYSTEILLSQPLEWNNMKYYYSGIGIDVARGGAEVERYKAARRFALNAPADSLLFDEMHARLGVLKAGSRPFFFAALTASSHLPWIDPLGRGDNESNVWSYVDLQLTAFYEKLRSDGFFNNGILIITADHRKMSQPTADERDKYGGSAMARIPLVMIGRGIGPDQIDSRLFQQSDLFRMLSQAAAGTEDLSPFVIHVERFTNPRLRVTTPGDFQVFESAGKARTGALGFVDGASLQWIGAKPSRHEKIEFAIHSQRALLQDLKARRPKSCGFDNVGDSRPSERPGLEVRAFTGWEITGELSKSMERFIGSKQAAQINFPEGLAGFSGRKRDFSLELDGFLVIDRPGQYGFKLESDDGSCLMLDGEMVIDSNETKPFSAATHSMYLDPGLRRLIVRYFQGSGESGLVLSWIRPGEKEWQVIPIESFRAALD